MRLSELKKQLKNYPIFKTSELLLFSNGNKHTLETQISQWVKKDELIQLKRGLYCFNPEKGGVKINKLLVANKLYEPSYISLEYALSHYGLIPEAAFQITSVTVRKTNKFTNKLGVYIYHHLKQDMFFGFKQEKINEDVILTADKEKALIDYLYINQKSIKPTDEYLESLRLQNIKMLSQTRLSKYARATGKAKIVKISQLFKKYDELT